MPRSEAVMDATDKLAVIISGLSQDNFPSEVIEDLIANKGADPNVRDEISGLTLLLKISTVGEQETAGAFHDKLLRIFVFFIGRPDVDVNIGLDLDHKLAIHHVCVMRDPAFLSLFLEHRPEARLGINALSSTGKAPLHFACANSMVPLENIRGLLVYGADPNMKCGRDGNTPLHYLMTAYADHNQLEKLVAILNEFFRNPLTKLGDPNLKNNKDQTLLHHAAGHIRSSSVINMLLSRGEYRSIPVKDKHLKTPFDYANLFGNKDVMGAICGFRRRIGG
jgi:hypothetical protein